MKKIFFIFNILFLVVGNSILSNIHHHEHSDCHYHQEEQDCEQCLIIKISNSYIVDYQEIFISHNSKSLFSLKHLDSISFYIDRQYLSRAPPIS
mgnify:CR=1 FL=1